MNALYFAPIVLSILLFGAHLFRHGATWPLIGLLAVSALLFVRRPWAARIMQFVLILATAEWVRTLVLLVGAHMQGGRPYLRLSVILILVILVTGLSAFMFQSPALRRIYGYRQDSDIR